MSLLCKFQAIIHMLKMKMLNFQKERLIHLDVNKGHETGTTVWKLSCISHSSVEGEWQGKALPISPLSESLLQKKKLERR